MRRRHWTHQKRTKTGRFTSKHAKGHAHYNRKRKAKLKTRRRGWFW